MRVEAYWNALDTIGLEHLVLEVSDEAVVADGLVLRHDQGEGLRLRYRLRCDASWLPRDLDVRLLAHEETRLHLRADGRGTWVDEGGRHLQHLDGCLAVDIMTTPFTNTLALRYLDLEPGETRELDVVYVTIPELRVERATQRYTCLARSRLDALYLYESPETGFRAELRVDHDQLVVTYENAWERAPASPSAR